MAMKIMALKPDVSRQLKVGADESSFGAVVGLRRASLGRLCVNQKHPSRDSMRHENPSKARRLEEKP
jgi:hypothetical protein